MEHLWNGGVGDSATDQWGINAPTDSTYVIPNEGEMTVCSLCIHPASQVQIITFESSFELVLLRQIDHLNHLGDL